MRSFAASAERLGLELALATDRCHLLDDPWRDGAIAVRFYDEDASLQAIENAARQRPIAGVIAVGDQPTVLAARVTGALGLPGHPVAAAQATRSKPLMRRALAVARMRTPWFFELASNADVASVAARVPYPCVVKPLGLSGSRGVIRADSRAQFIDAAGRVRALLARPDVRAQRTGLTDRLLVEGFIDGEEYAVEGLLTAGVFRLLALFDKPDPLDGPYFEETIYVTPSRAPGHLQDAIAAEVQRAATAIGLVHGPVHAECRVGPAGITMLEVAARPIGGLCSSVLRFERGAETAPLEELLLRHAIGDDVSGWQREGLSAGVMMIPIPRRGSYKAVRGEAAASAVPAIEEVKITAKPDQLLERLPEGDSYLGFIFARAETPGDVVLALRSAHAKLDFDIEPALRVIR